MRRLLWIAAVVVFVGAAAPSKAPMADFVRAVLPFANANFAPLRGAQIQSFADTVYAGYTLHLDPAICSDCWIYDLYGRGKHVEYWEVSNIYTEDPSGAGILIQPSYSSARATAAPASPLPSASPGAEIPPPIRSTPPPQWSIQKTENYVKAQLAPLLPGFSLHRTASTGLTGVTVPTLVWRNRHNVWVVAQMYPYMIAGFLKVGLRVGHDLPKSAHVLLPATQAQLARRQSATGQLIRTAVPAAATNFSALRGSAINEDPGGHEYLVTAAFGPAFRSCEILDIGARMGQSSPYTSDWALLCTTVATLGKRASQEDLVRAAISSALPSGFTSDAAGAKARGYDYLWSNSSGVSVAIDWGDPQDDVVSFTVRITHSLPK